MPSIFFTSVKSDEQVLPRPVSYCSGCMLYASSGCDESWELRMRDNMEANRDPIGFGQANANFNHKNHFRPRCEDCTHACVRGLYTGLTASVFRQMTYSVTRLGVYDVMKNAMSNNGVKKLRTGDMVICASVAGALGGVAGNPADIILVRYVVLRSNQAAFADKRLSGRRMVADPTKPVDHQVHYKNAIHGVYKMVSNEGIASLARGLAPNIIRATLMNASQLVSYDFFKDHILAANLMENGMPLHFVSSALSGTVATTICAPADVVKSRIMNMKAGAGGHGPVGLLLESLTHEGPRFLFKGWLPAWIRLTPNTICMFVFLEQLRNAVDLFRNSSARSQPAAQIA
ncbi:solute carrier family 25 (mitochondrial dicarboxylate transporter), member 10 [Cryptococcus gattii E566]|uniref:Dicarboxylic acid transporter, putative n=2 Tax=Cryptococcus gattii TaxID=37769 RepID=E6R4S4_CRYGW|nr:dicarboxylic acid transporter, putative [Cryptococcus gattii WM276]ADV22078.1 dicarboxylic acid transporter, putative [Cryptococcus gattii WM276]KIR80483.1 solute carrier family 25 (mitochondrial dicarboxylate transporter), member 10 [Cryptococcus gattii EJB2]KIY33528.1 solute carrier family 25 (mitochondrial dicarboxylate transporter), member 10 [Cryptococcus gattii E566]KJE03421.1 solute carrier family 25 (mitochondrial dicarboxylate transporter), member 10 [Cryptococcus gattii NT-10]